MCSAPLTFEGKEDVPNLGISPGFWLIAGNPKDSRVIIYDTGSNRRPSLYWNLKLRSAQMFSVVKI